MPRMKAGQIYANNNVNKLILRKTLETLFSPTPGFWEALVRQDNRSVLTSQFEIFQRFLGTHILFRSKMIIFKA